MRATIYKRCGHTGCPRIVPSSVRYCDLHRRQKNQTYGRAFKARRAAIMAAHGWACHYCGGPVTLSDDVAHLEPTSRMTPAQAQRTPNVVPAHRRCHNENAPAR